VAVVAVSAVVVVVAVSVVVAVVVFVVSSGGWSWEVGSVDLRLLYPKAESLRSGKEEKKKIKHVSQLFVNCNKRFKKKSQNIKCAF
jgi:hypothetical protein